MVSQFLGLQHFYVGFKVASFELGLQPEAGVVKTKFGGINIYWGVRAIVGIFSTNNTCESNSPSIK